MDLTTTCSEERRRALADTIELIIDPARRDRGGLDRLPRIPVDHCEAVVEPLREIAVALRDTTISVAEDAARRITVLATAPTSPVFAGPATVARFAALSLLAQLTVCEPPAFIPELGHGRVVSLAV
jgi:hypothetical protein